MTITQYFIRIFLFALLIFAQPIANQATERVIILTDVENEPDDAQSLVRLMLYSNQIDIQGIVATTSTHMRNRVAPETILKIIDAYGKVRSNLLLHETGYPEANYLKSCVKSGLAVYGMEGVGKDCDSEGSELIIKILEQPDERPLWVCVWGGTNVLAQALFKLKNTKSEAELNRLIGKLRIYTISDQDDSGIWIRQNFPSLFYIVSPGGYGNATWSGMMQVADGADNEKTSNSWITKNIQQQRNPLAACYPDVAYGMEGDTPSWLNLIPNGLNSPEHPNWGGWGGRYEFYKPDINKCDPNGFNGNVPIEPEPHAIWTNAIDHFTPYIDNEFGCAVRKDTIERSGYTATVWRWRTDVQNDFAARMAWCTVSYANANHPPQPKLSHPTELTVKCGEFFALDASPTTDPDGDALSFLWFCYPEAGGSENIETDGSPNIHRAVFKAPNKPSVVHIILKVTDKGTPQLSRYQRIIVNVE